MFAHAILAAEGRIRPGGARRAHAERLPKLGMAPSALLCARGECQTRLPRARARVVIGGAGHARSTCATCAILVLAPDSKRLA